MEFAGELSEPTQFGTKLLDHQADHPDGLMKAMAYVSATVAQRGLFTREFLLQKFLSPAKLQAKGSGTRLPGERKPGKKWRALALRGPFLAFQSIGQRRSTLRRGGKHAALRSNCR